jgi:hypothetical protein
MRTRLIKKSIFNFNLHFEQSRLRDFRLCQNDVPRLVDVIGCVLGGASKIGIYLSHLFPSASHWESFYLLACGRILKSCLERMHQSCLKISRRRFMRLNLNEKGKSVNQISDTAPERSSRIVLQGNWNQQCSFGLIPRVNRLHENVIPLPGVTTFNQIAVL